MDIARTSMIHARAPHFLWPYAVCYAAHQLNHQPRVSQPGTSPTSIWTGSPNVGSAFCVWGCLELVRNTSADKLSARAMPSVFLGFPVDSFDYTFYHPPLHRFLDSRDSPHQPSALPRLVIVDFGVVGAGGAGTGGASSRGAGAGGAGAGGDSYGGAGAGGAGTRELRVVALEVLVPRRLELEALLLRLPTDTTHVSRRLADVSIVMQLFPPVSGLSALGLPSAPPVHSQSTTTYGPTFPPLEPAPAVFSPHQSQLPPPVLPHDWTTRYPPRARPSSPLHDLRTVLFRSSPGRAPLVSVLPPPPASSLTVSSHPIIDYYHAACPVVLRVLISLTNRHASPLSFLALTAYVADFASTRRLDFATRVVAAPPARPVSTRGPWASQWKAAMDLELASWRSTGTYVDAVPPPWVNVVDGMWLFMVKRPPRSPPVFTALCGEGLQPARGSCIVQDPSL
ncbi:unnamed protein product [Closterium sp. NIES-54]